MQNAIYIYNELILNAITSLPHIWNALDGLLISESYCNLYIIVST